MIEISRLLNREQGAEGLANGFHSTMAEQPDFSQARVPLKLKWGLKAVWIELVASGDLLGDQVKLPLEAHETDCTSTV